MSTSSGGWHWNWTEFCGTTFSVWNEPGFSSCFQSVALALPAHSLLAITSAYYIQRCPFLVLRPKLHKYLLWIRLCVCLSLATIPWLRVGFLYSTYHSPWSLPLVEYLQLAVEFVAWLLHAVVIQQLFTSISCHCRGPLIVTISWFLTCICSIIAAVFINNEADIRLRYLPYVTVGVQAVYLLTLFSTSKGHVYFPAQSLLVNGDVSERTPLLNTATADYRTIEVPTTILGDGYTSASLVSKILISWMTPLLRKGKSKDINSIDDLMDLPPFLQTKNTLSKFWTVYRAKYEQYWQRQPADHKPTDNRFPTFMFAIVFKAFGWKLVKPGVFIIVREILRLMSPLMLQQIVLYVESGSHTGAGYLYAAGLLLLQFTASLFDVNFLFYRLCVGLRVRSALMAAIYKKVLSLTGAHLAGFTSGQVVNYISTDCERLLFGTTRFTFICSLPITIGITFYLLYVEVGVAFVAGIIVTVVLVVVNQILTTKLARFNTKVMAHKDKRVKVMSEILHAVRAIKFYVWEGYFHQRIETHRNNEIRFLKKMKYMDAFLVYMWATTPVLIATSTFAAYVMMGHTLTVAKVFTCLTLFNMLLLPLNLLPWVINLMVEAYVSGKRLQALFLMPETAIRDFYSPLDGLENEVLSIQDASFIWHPKIKNMDDKDSKENNNKIDTGSSANSNGHSIPVAENNDYIFRLENINVTVHKGDFVCVAGAVGSGKTALINAILGEIVKQSGQVGLANIADGFAYVGQEPWLQRGSVKFNILCGSPFDPERYANVLHACALDYDMQNLARGDETEVGENGLSLSGGQRARVGLARALYQNKDFYLLDSPLSAVDAHVGNHILEKCLLGYLAGKTRIMVTYHRTAMEKADTVWVIENGKINQQGPVLGELGLPPMSSHGETGETSRVIEEREKQEEKAEGEDDSEEWERGGVRYVVYKSYLWAIGYWLCAFILFALLLMQVSRNLSDLWLAYYMSHAGNSTNPSNVTLSSHMQFMALSPSWWHNPTIVDFLIIYLSISAFNSTCALIRAYAAAYGGIRAAISLHRNLLDSVLKATMAFFETNPLGRILNRFSSDVWSIDDNLPAMTNVILDASFIMIGTIVVIGLSIPWLILLIVPLTFVYFKIQRYYRATSRELKRLSSITMSPIYNHLSESFSGLVVIRAFRMEARFMKENVDRVEKNQRSRFCMFSVMCWLELRLQMIGIIVVSCAALLSVLFHEYSYISPVFVGLALSYSLQIGNALEELVYFVTEAEKEAIAVERVQQYVEGAAPERLVGTLQPPTNWLSPHPVVKFENVRLCYRPGLPASLKNVTFETMPGERLGIVGRTGAGKSSLLTALFRLVELEAGAIYLDGVNIHHLDLDKLRSNLAVIPQEPNIFSGTIRENLDPLHRCSDDELWEALRQSHMANEIQRLGGLDTELSESGKELSAGQKQLLCLARALLINGRVLCIDEATANVDPATESLVQDTILTQFRDTTVLTIAHRITTVMACDRVMVMSDGQVAEIGPPAELLRDSASAFYQLVHAGSS